MLRQPGMNIYAKVEPLVHKIEFEHITLLNNAYSAVNDTARARGSVEPTGHWTGQFWAWAEAAAQWFHQANPVNF